MRGPQGPLIPSGLLGVAALAAFVAADLVDGPVGGVLRLLDLLAVLALGLVVDEVRGLVDAAVDLLLVVADRGLRLARQSLGEVLGLVEETGHRAHSPCACCAGLVPRA